MKVVLVHDYIKEYGGAERVLETLHEIYPSAPIFTSVYYPQFLGPHRNRFDKMDIRTSWLQYIPFGYKLISPMRLLSPFIFKRINLSSYDLIIVSQTGAYFPNNVRKNSLSSSLGSEQIKLMTYTHTPPRYLYGYKTARDWKKNKLFLILGEGANHILRMVDFYSSKNVDLFIANSEEVRARIKKFYRRDAIVINPPVVLDQRVRIKDLGLKENYYLAGGRLARAKGMDIIIDAFNKNSKPLKIFGKGFAGYGEELRKKAKKNIEFVGEVNDEEKLRLMEQAKAFIFASFDEDFGITPVEAMGMGTPVIAYKSGGVQETVVEGKTGVFYESNTADQLNVAIRTFEKKKLKVDDCYQQAAKFGKEIFIRKIKNLER